MPRFNCSSFLSRSAGAAGTGSPNWASSRVPKIPWLIGLFAFAFLLGLFLLPAHMARAASADAPKVEEARESTLDFSDFLYVRNPIPGTSVEVDYRFEQSSEPTNLGSTLMHSDEVGLVLNLAPTEWLNLSLGMPYQFLTVHPADGSTPTQTNNLGYLTAETFVTLLRDPVRRLAVSVGFDVGFPTGSIHDGMGGQWTLTRFVNAEFMLGPIQVLADVDFMFELRSLPGAGEPKQELLFNLGVGYPITGWILPFLTVNSAYAFSGPSEIRHRGQFYLSPGVRIGPGAVKGEVEPNRPPARAEGANGVAGQRLATEPWWKGLSMAVAPQFPLAAAREFEWAITTSLKPDF